MREADRAPGLLATSSGASPTTSLLALRRMPGVMAKAQGDLRRPAACPATAIAARASSGPNLTDDYWLHGGRPTRDLPHHHRGRAGEGHGALEDPALARGDRRRWPPTWARCAAPIRRTPSRRRAQKVAADGRAAPLRGSMTHCALVAAREPGARASHAQPGRHAALDAPQALRGTLPPAPAGPGLGADRALHGDSVSPDGRQARHPARCREPALRALRRDLSADRHHAAHAPPRRPLPRHLPRDRGVRPGLVRLGLPPDRVHGVSLPSHRAAHRRRPAGAARSRRPAVSHPGGSSSTRSSARSACFSPTPSSRTSWASRLSVTG